MLYLLNAPILPSYGDYRFHGPIDAAAARERIAKGFNSAIGHAATAEILSALLKCPIPLNRISITMEAGDAALVFRLRSRLPEGWILSKTELAKLDYELGWLERIA